MVEFEPPKRKALSESELHRALTELGNTSDGLVQAEVLLSNQAIAREADSKALADWIAQMQALGTQQAQRALANMVLDVLPPELVETAVPESVSAPDEPEAVFTSEISVIRSRRQLRTKYQGIRRLVAGLAGALLLGVTNTTIAMWLGLNLSESIASAALGLVLAVPFVWILKSHHLHPLLRSAAVFGGWGVYVGAGLILASMSLLVVECIDTVVTNRYLVDLFAGYSSDVLLVTAVAVAVGQAIPRSWFFPAVVVIGAAIFGFVIWQNPFALSNFVFPAVDSNRLIWGSIAMGFASALIYSFGQPHFTISLKSLSLQFPFGFLLSSLLLLFATPNPIAISAPILLLISVSLSGRDLSAQGLGRVAGLVFVIPVVLFPWLDLVTGPAVAMLSTLLILITFDQLIRKTSLHIPSLDTSYGFYGAFQPLTFCAIAIAGVLGVDFIQRQLLLPILFNHLEYSALLGIAVGLLFGLLRIISIRKQDREIRNVEFRNMNLDNLLGL